MLVKHVGEKFFYVGEKILYVGEKIRYVGEIIMLVKNFYQHQGPKNRLMLVKECW